MNGIQEVGSSILPSSTIFRGLRQVVAIPFPYKDISASLIPLAITWRIRMEFMFGFIIFLFLFIYPFLCIAELYNKCIDYEEKINVSAANIKATEQKRNDTIRQIVQVVVKNTSHDSRIVGQVAQAREYLNKGKFNLAMSTVRVIYENYPDISSINSFRSLSEEICKIESEIKTERDIFNESILNYKSFTRKFPNNIILKMIPKYKIKDASYFATSSDDASKPVDNMFS